MTAENAERTCLLNFVIASAAKQSRNPSADTFLDCFAALAMTGLAGYAASFDSVEDPPMQYRQLGRSGLKVSPICLGTMMFGGPTDEAVSKRIIDKARGAGINFIDTADAYSKGASEEVVGRAIADSRQAWVLATKLANPMNIGMGDDPNRVGLSRRWVLQAADESLKRLGTDHIDIYYLHKEDHATPLEETVRAMGDLIRAGKVRYFGVSNYRAWRVAEICNICDRLGIDRPAVSQPYYNAMNRMPEVEHFPACAYYGLGIVPYSPLARGVLTGKYKPDAAPDKETRAGRNDTRMMQTEWRPESLQLAQEIKSHSERKGITAGQFAVAWVLNSAFVSSIVAGPRTEEQWDDYIGALDYRFTADDEELIDRLVVPGHPSTPGYNDPAYPIEGRRARTA
ncbi:aryl-alcohol dehydrogenase-like predicted oxidoreductase [Bradyrhizobium sp. USDA 4486]